MAESRKEAYERGLHRGRIGGVKRALEAVAGRRSAKQCREALDALLVDLEREALERLDRVDPAETE